MTQSWLLTVAVALTLWTAATVDNLNQRPWHPECPTAAC